MDTINLGDLWDVQLRNGVMDIMTLDQLDAAFEAGRIDAATLVRERGTAAWSTLGAVAGLDAPEAPLAATPAALPSAPPNFMPAAYSSPNSMAPMVADLDFDVAPPQFQTSRKPIIFAGVAIAAVVGIIGFVVLGGSSAEATPAAAAVAAPPAPQPLPVAAPAKVDAPASDRLSDDQKKALLSQDKKKDQARKNRAAPASHPGGKRPNSGPVFHKGGNQYDPLNSNL